MGRVGLTGAGPSLLIGEGMPHDIIPDVDEETSEAICEECGEHIDLVFDRDLEIWLHGSELAARAEEEYKPLPALADIFG